MLSILNCVRLPSRAQPQTKNRAAHHSRTERAPASNDREQLFGHGDGMDTGQRSAYLTYPSGICTKRHHSDRLAGLRTPFRLRTDRPHALSIYSVVNSIPHFARFATLFSAIIQKHYAISFFIQLYVLSRPCSNCIFRSASSRRAPDAESATPHQGLSRSSHSV